MLFDGVNTIHTSLSINVQQRYRCSFHLEEFVFNQGLIVSIAQAQTQNA